MNVKLLTFKWSKSGVKWKVCILSTNFWQSQAMMMLELLWRDLESWQLNQLWQFWLIELTTLNAWMWIYRPSKRPMLDSNERCASLLLTLGGLERQWCQNCCDKALKVDNSISPNNAIIIQKPTYFFCVHTQNFLNEFLSKVYNSSLKIKRLEMDSKP
jgi:hypothetical protein